MEFIKKNLILILIVIVIIYVIILFKTKPSPQINNTSNQKLHHSKNNIYINNKKGYLVHERILYGLPGQIPIQYSNSEKLISMVYNPFRYAVPPKKPNTNRKYRLYAIYSDNMTRIGNHEIKICFGNWGNCNKNVIFKFPRTWGTPSPAPTAWNRDAFSNWINEEQVLNPHHSHIKARTTVSSTGVMRKLILQIWDFNK
jgi:hypothetical protein